MFESLDEIRTYLCVVETKSLSAAARSMRLSVNAVFQRLSRIEERAGVRLIERTTRTLRVTEVGERVARRARRILDELSDAEHEVSAGGGERLRGVVKVAVSSDVAAGAFLAEVGQLLVDNPALSVELIGKSRLVEPVVGGVDLVVWPGPVTTQASTVKRIGVIEWALAAAPSYVARRGAPQTPEELSAHGCLLAIRGKREASLTLSDSGGQEREVPVSAQLSSDATEVLTAALHAGLGIGMRPRREVHEGVAAGRLVPILPAYRLPPMEVSLVSPAGRLRSAPVRAVADLLARRLRWLAAAEG